MGQQQSGTVGYGIVQNIRTYYCVPGQDTETIFLSLLSSTDIQIWTRTVGSQLGIEDPDLHLCFHRKLVETQDKWLYMWYDASNHNTDTELNAVAEDMFPPVDHRRICGPVLFTGHPLEDTSPPEGVYILLTESKGYDE